MKITANQHLQTPVPRNQLNNLTHFACLIVFMQELSEKYSENSFDVFTRLQSSKSCENILMKKM
jgi:hypothetical protein